MILSEIREIKDLVGLENLREVLENISESELDFEVGNYRFIVDSEIDDIMCMELEQDDYVLGCFNADFLSDNTNLSYDIIVALQEADKYEIIGQHIIDNNQVCDIQLAYAQHDGYGHHFGHYDGNDTEIGDYHLFRIN